VHPLILIILPLIVLTFFRREKARRYAASQQIGFAGFKVSPFLRHLEYAMAGALVSKGAVRESVASLAPVTRLGH
jgi:hypothetical protein